MNEQEIGEDLSDADLKPYWDGVGNSGMRFMEECDVLGGKTDCFPRNADSVKS